MIKKRDFGNIGEEYAAAYLVNQGYQIVERNWTSGHKEIDIIAFKDGIVVFVEVKTRRTARYGNPEEAVSDKKAQLVVIASQHYLQSTTLFYKDIRFDIVALLMEKGIVKDFLHIQDAFY